jgi:arsenate reductase (thioredoxin)
MAKTILVLCTGNSARSIMAEAYLNHIGGGRLQAVSAGSNPTGRVNPLAIAALADAGIPPPAEPRSKSWNAFSQPGAPPIDLVLTVCDNAANEACPHFPGPARKIHLGFPDPAAATGSDAEKLAAFRQVFADMRPKLDELAKGVA